MKKPDLTPEQLRILRQKGTEAPFSGQYFNHDEQGMYNCAYCGAPLFSSTAKFEPKAPGLQGWPSFSNEAKNGAVQLSKDTSYGLDRIAISCGKCGSHLGHLFEDVPGEEHRTHYCINSACLAFKPADPKN